MGGFGRARYFGGLLLVLSAWTIVAAGPAAAQTPTDYLTQMVCVDAYNVATSADPIGCPTSRRKLAVGEALPYHKVDRGGYQISDSFPISDINGVSLGIQTYFFTADLGADSWFPDVHFMPRSGGYNVLGADGSYVFFRGTHDTTGGWQPWWTASCEAKGWRLFPNTSSAFSYGSDTSPTINTPSCATATSTAAATVEWNHYNVTYAQAGASTKTLDSLVDFHYSPGYLSIEVNYFTQEYGVTRWEAWVRGTGGTTTDTKGQCPNSLYDATLHGYQFYLADCRDWSTVQALTTPWNPAGTSPTNSNLPNWPVDPLYTSTNLLQNSHIGGPYTSYGSTYCSVANWSRVLAPNTLNWWYDPATTGPFVSSGNCSLQFGMIPTPAGEAIYQQVWATGSGDYTFGTMLWAPNYVSGPQPQVYVQVIERDSSGNLTGSSAMLVSLTDKPETFAHGFTINSSTTNLFFVLYPQDANTVYEFTGAWIAQKP